MKKRYIIIDENKIEYYLSKKKMKNINIRIKQDSNIYLSCPLNMKTEEAEKFLIQKYNWILKQQEKLSKYSGLKEQINLQTTGKVYFLGNLYILNIIPSIKNNVEIENENIKLYIKERYINNKNYINKYYDTYLKDEAYKIFEDLVIKYQKQMAKYVRSFPQIEIKKLKTRWGSCMPIKNKVTFNLSLIKTPMECIEYVVVHELAHFKYQNHSRNFYNLVEIYVPDWKDRRKLLNSKYSILV